jgi:hypothetical protein
VYRYIERGDGLQYALADVQVARASDFGRNDTTYYVRSHLGAILQAGDTVIGYAPRHTHTHTHIHTVCVVVQCIGAEVMMVWVGRRRRYVVANANLNNDEYEKLNQKEVPDVVRAPCAAAASAHVCLCIHACSTTTLCVSVCVMRGVSPSTRHALV